MLSLHQPLFLSTTAFLVHSHVFFLFMHFWPLLGFFTSEGGWRVRTMEGSFFRGSFAVFIDSIVTVVFYCMSLMSNLWTAETQRETDVY
jgi:hypothetical protein